MFLFQPARLLTLTRCSLGQGRGSEWLRGVWLLGQFKPLNWQQSVLTVILLGKCLFLVAFSWSSLVQERQIYVKKCCPLQITASAACNFKVSKCVFKRLLGLLFSILTSVSGFTKSLTFFLLFQFVFCLCEEMKRSFLCSPCSLAKTITGVWRVGGYTRSRKSLWLTPCEQLPISLFI